MTKNTNKTGHDAGDGADALEIASRCMAREAKLTARIAGPAEKEILEKMAEAFKDPERVRAFIGSAA